MNAPWRTLADDLEAQQEIERTADCAERYLAELIEKGAFEEVHFILLAAAIRMDVAKRASLRAAE